MRDFEIKHQIHEFLDTRDIRGIIFDLDNTLVAERTYVSCFTNKLSELVTAELGLLDGKAFAKFFLDEWDLGNRKNLFQRAIVEFQLKTVDIDDFKYHYSTTIVPGGFRLFPWAEEFLSGNRMPVAILSNGDPITQKNKFSQLSPKHILRDVNLWCANEFVAKPDPAGALAISLNWKISTNQVLFIGDSDQDRLCALNAGCEFLSVNQ